MDAVQLATSRHAKLVDVLKPRGLMVESVLGEGGFGIVLKCADTHGNQCALKVYDKGHVKSMMQARDLQRIRFEAEVLKTFSHPNINGMLWSHETPDGIYLSMEYAPHGDLFQNIVAKGHLEELEALHYFRQIVDALAYIHDLDIIHRDIKPMNILIYDGNVAKLSDFGLCCRILPGRLLVEAVGSLDYAAPEVLCEQPYEGPEVDVWSLGVTLYSMVCGFLPFRGDTDAEIFSKIIAADFFFPSFLSQNVCRLLDVMMDPDGCERILLEEIVKSPWYIFGGGDVSNAPIIQRPAPSMVSPHPNGDVDDAMVAMDEVLESHASSHHQRTESPMWMEKDPMHAMLSQEESLEARIQLEPLVEEDIFSMQMDEEEMCVMHEEEEEEMKKKNTDVSTHQQHGMMAETSSPHHGLRDSLEMEHSTHESATIEHVPVDQEMEEEVKEEIKHEGQQSKAMRINVPAQVHQRPLERKSASARSVPSAAPLSSSVPHTARGLHWGTRTYTLGSSHSNLSNPRRASLTPRLWMDSPDAMGGGIRSPSLGYGVLRSRRPSVLASCLNTNEIYHNIRRRSIAPAPEDVPAAIKFARKTNFPEKPIPPPSGGVSRPLSRSVTSEGRISSARAYRRSIARSDIRKLSPTSSPRVFEIAIPRSSSAPSADDAAASTTSPSFSKSILRLRNPTLPLRRRKASNDTEEPSTGHTTHPWMSKINKVVAQVGPPSSTLANVRSHSPTHQLHRTRGIGGDTPPRKGLRNRAMAGEGSELCGALSVLPDEYDNSAERPVCPNLQSCSSDDPTHFLIYSHTPSSSFSKIKAVGKTDDIIRASTSRDGPMQESPESDRGDASRSAREERSTTRHEDTVMAHAEGGEDKVRMQRHSSGGGGSGAMDHQPPLEGWLMKRGDINKMWRRRFFRLAVDTPGVGKDADIRGIPLGVDERVRRVLTYCDSDRHGARVLGTIDLAKVTRVRIKGESSSTTGGRDASPIASPARLDRLYHGQEADGAMEPPLHGGGARAREPREGTRPFRQTMSTTRRERGGYTFDVVVPERVYRLRAETQGDRERWVSGLRALIAAKTHDGDDLDDGSSHAQRPTSTHDDSDVSHSVPSVVVGNAHEPPEVPEKAGQRLPHQVRSGLLQSISFDDPSSSSIHAKPGEKPTVALRKINSLSSKRHRRNRSYDLSSMNSQSSDHRGSTTPRRRLRIKPWKTFGRRTGRAEVKHAAQLRHSDGAHLSSPHHQANDGAGGTPPTKRIASKHNTPRSSDGEEL